MRCGFCEFLKPRCERLRLWWEGCLSPCSMDIGQLCSILAACISTNPEQRKAGEATLEQVLPLINIFQLAYYRRQIRAAPIGALLTPWPCI